MATIHKRFQKLMAEEKGLDCYIKADGVLHIGSKPLYQRLLDLFFWNIEPKIKAKATSMVIYIDRGQEKYWDVGMKVKGTGADILAYKEIV